ncbi:hypothetical protein HDU91_002206 [Kappamyces sp. JEL0680]|nr:hypothetical protein HDU91_002206 [Kappamyces sp. JEL0680]
MHLQNGHHWDTVTAFYGYDGVSLNISRAWALDTWRALSEQALGSSQFPVQIRLAEKVFLMKRLGSSAETGSFPDETHSSWLVQCTLPSLIKYTMLLDPWFHGAQIDGHAWFSLQLPSVSSVGSIDELPPLDCIVIGFEFTDHLHKETLLGASQDTPVFCVAHVAGILKSWNHFRHIFVIRETAASLQDLSQLPHLPPDVFLTFVPGSGLKRHIFSTLVIRHQHNVVLYQPHGSNSRRLAAFVNSLDNPKQVTLLSPLSDISLPLIGLVALGSPRLLDLICDLDEQSKPRQILVTHQVVKVAKGIVGSLLQRSAVSRDEGFMEARTMHWLWADCSAPILDLAEGESITL